MTHSAFFACVLRRVAEKDGIVFRGAHGKGWSFSGSASSAWNAAFSRSESQIGSDFSSDTLRGTFKDEVEDIAGNSVIDGAATAGLQSS